VRFVPCVSVCAVSVVSESEVAAGGRGQRLEGSDVPVDEDGEVLVSGLGGDAGEWDTGSGGRGRVSGAQGVGGDTLGVQAGGVGCRRRPLAACSARPCQAAAWSTSARPCRRRVLPDGGPHTCLTETGAGKVIVKKSLPLQCREVGTREWVNRKRYATQHQGQRQLPGHSPQTVGNAGML
jgi:hypothetical protein